MRVCVCLFARLCVCTVGVRGWTSASSIIGPSHIPDYLTMSRVFLTPVMLFNKIHIILYVSLNMCICQLMRRGDTRNAHMWDSYLKLWHSLRTEGLATLVATHKLLSKTKLLRYLFTLFLCLAHVQCLSAQKINSTAFSGSPMNPAPFLETSTPWLSSQPAHPPALVFISTLHCDK